MHQSDRGHQWMQACDAIGRLEQFAVVVPQGLARLDLQLIDEAEALQQRLASLTGPEEISGWLARRDLLADHLTLSYLWALGGYEVIRTVDERVGQGRPSVGQLVQQEIKSTKRLYERVRLPLAKMKPTWRHEATDAVFPAIEFGSTGVSWEVAPGVVITRRELADRLLGTLLSIHSDLGLT